MQRPESRHFISAGSKVERWPSEVAIMEDRHLKDEFFLILGNLENAAEVGAFDGGDGNFERDAGAVGTPSNFLS